MRTLINDTDSQVSLHISNHYGQKMRSHTLAPQESITLPRKGLEIYTLDSEQARQRVYLYKGKGEQPLSLSYVEYDFSRLEIKPLSIYIFKGTEPKSQELESYKAFKDLSEINLKAGKDIITPKHYNDLWEQILAYHTKKESQCVWKRLLHACVRI